MLKVVQGDGESTLEDGTEVGDRDGAWGEESVFKMGKD